MALSCGAVVVGPGLVNDGAWHHLVGTASSSDVSLYVDGAQVGAAKKPAGMGYGGADTAIGVPPFPGNYHFEGSIDDVAVYDHVLTPAQVATHYQAATSGVGSVTAISPTQVTSQPAGAAAPADAGRYPPGYPSDCPDVAIFGMRGSGEYNDPADLGMGRVGNIVATKILQQLPSDMGVNRIGVDYDAVGFDPRQNPLYILTGVAAFNNYRASVASGADRLVNKDDGVGMLHDQLVHCPQIRVALIGFSQGAHVIQYALSGAPSSPSAVTQQILAILLYGDPVRQPGRSYNVGNPDAHGLFSNPEVFPLLPGNSGTPEMPDYLQAVAQSYCRDGDPICDQPGSSDMSSHSYADTQYIDAGVEFAVKRLLVGW